LNNLIIGGSMNLKIFCKSNLNKITGLFNNCFKYSKNNFDIINNIEDVSNYAETINNQKPDLIFVNLEDKIINWLDIFKNITHTPYIVFILDDKEIPYKILEFNRLNYFTADCILNPLNDTKINKVLERFYKYIKNKNNKKEKIKFNLDDSIFYFNKKDIYYITTCEKYRLIKTKEGNYYSNKFLKYYEIKLKDKGFKRIHRYYLVNMNKVRKIEKINYRKIFIYFEDLDKKIKVGRKYIRKF